MRALPSTVRGPVLLDRDRGFAGGHVLGSLVGNRNAQRARRTCGDDVEDCVSGAVLWSNPRERFRSKTAAARLALGGAGAQHGSIADRDRHATELAELVQRFCSEGGGDLGAIGNGIALRICREPQEGAFDVPRRGSQTQKLSKIAEAEISDITVPGKKFT